MIITEIISDPRGNMYLREREQTAEELENIERMNAESSDISPSEALNILLGGVDVDEG